MLSRCGRLFVCRAVMQAPGGQGQPWTLLPAAAASTDAHRDAIRSMEQAAQQGDLQQLMNIVEGAGESFDGQTVEAALRQVERCTHDMSREEVQQKVHNTKTFQMLADMAVSTAGHAPAEVLAGMIGVFGRLGFKDEMVLDSLARHIMPSVKHLEPHKMQEMVEGLKQADHSPGVLLLDEVHGRLTEMQGVPDEQVQSIKEGMRDLGWEDSNVPNPGAQAQPDRIKYT